MNNYIKKFLLNNSKTFYSFYLNFIIVIYPHIIPNITIYYFYYYLLILPLLETYNTLVILFSIKLITGTTNKK